MFYNHNNKILTPNNSIMKDITNNVTNANTLYDDVETKYVDPITLFGPFNIEEFEMFKNNNLQSGKVFYCLNNFPNTVYEMIYNVLCYSNYNTMSKNYYSCIIKKIGNRYDYNFKQLYNNISDFIGDLIDDNIRFITIRICELGNIIGHVMSIIIDKQKKYILFFDPKNDIKFSLDQFMFVINTVNAATSSDYQILLPYDIGYNKGKRLQGINMYCQTYILYVYALIICNHNIPYKNFKVMFTSIINNKSVSLFLFLLYKVISCNKNFDNIEFDLPCISNPVINIFNSLSLVIRLNIKKLVDLYKDNKLKQYQLNEIETFDDSIFNLNYDNTINNDYANKIENIDDVKIIKEKHTSL